MNEFNKDMDEIWKEIEKATDEIDIPESLLPENIVEKLEKKKIKEKRNNMRRISEMAAIAAVVVAIGGVGTNYYWNSGIKLTESAMDSSASYTESTMDAGAESFVTQESVDKADNINIAKNKKKTIGKHYHLANNYDEIYDMIKESGDRYFIEDEVVNSGEEMMKGEDAIENSGAYGSAGVDTSTGTNADKESYSSTNLQEEGIDESDIIKTDGKYMYRVWNNKVYIIDIQKKKMEKVSEISLKNNVSDTVREIYLDGNKLCVITECMETKLDKDSENEDIAESSTDIISNKQMTGFRYYNVNTKISTKLSVYNIENRKNPVIEGEMIQEGCYYTSRKVNNMMYLFTRKNFGRFYADYEEAIPYIQGEKVNANCIYLPEKNISNELIAASVNMNEPDKVVDQLVVMSSYADIYMGQNAFYLYEREYKSDKSYTNISKFKYDKDGYMEGVNATSVKGDIEDTFAISEKGNNLRVLTTDWSGADRVNQLYILDNKMKLKGEINNIAKGESIYAARYIGDMAYFITYRNTDPLFVADLSNPAKPKLLGSVKVSGFSDYLHPYGKNKILGIGYETDKNSQTLGVKLCMFDVKNPKKPKVLNSFVIDGADDTPAANNYKCVLVDVEKNMIGFLVQDYVKDQCYTYKIFSWKNGKFKQVFSKKLKNKDWVDVNEVRGLYSGSKFYLIKEGSLISYDMKNKYKKIDSIKFK